MASNKFLLKCKHSCRFDSFGGIFVCGFGQIIKFIFDCDRNSIGLTANYGLVKDEETQKKYFEKFESYWGTLK